jgi:small-conductance mechanosensitive channel
VQYALPLAAFCAALAITFIIRNFILRWIRRNTEVVEGVRVATVLWCLAIAVAVALRYMHLPPDALHEVNRWLGAFIIISVSLVLSNVAVRTLTLYGAQHPVAFAVSGLSRTLARVFILSIGAIVLLRHFGFEITPLITALGIGGLAVALALQDTLANFFAGIHILLETPITVGDTIRLSSGEEGVVTDIGWRTTRVLTGGHSIIVIPNTKITSSTLTNFSMPEARVSAEVPIYVAHSAEVERVAEIALDVAAATPGVLDDPAPMVLFDPGLTPTHLEFKAVLHVARQSAKGPVLSEYRAQLLERFRAADIPLPVTDRMAWTATAARVQTNS